MKKAERILGIVSMVCFCLGVFFRILNLPGSTILFVMALVVFNSGYLLVQLILQRRTASRTIEHLYLIVRFITLFILMTGIVMDFQFWPGGYLIFNIGKILLIGLLLFYIFLRYKGIRQPASPLTELILALIAFGIFFYSTNSTVSNDTLDGYVVLLDQYEKENAGIVTSNNLIYSSMTSNEVPGDSSLKQSILKVNELSERLISDFDALTREFILYCTNEQYSTIKELDRSSDRFTLMNGELGDEFFKQAEYGEILKNNLEYYVGRITVIARQHNLHSGMIGLGLDVGDIQDEYGNQITWERVMFSRLRVITVLTNLLSIKQKILLTESTILNGLLGQVTLSDDAKLLQELAATESENAMEKKESEIIRIKQQQELQEVLLQKSEAEIRQRNLLIFGAFAGVVFVLVLFVISTRTYLLKRNDNKRLAEKNLAISEMNQELNHQNEEIMAHRDEIEAQRDMVYKQKDLIEKTHSEISASIDYAVRLQTSILPSPGLLNTRIADHFVLFKPKQRVSGDFYWWTQIEDQVVVAAADCTGHGVPGAFMSMLGVSMLREIVSKEYISHPGVVLRRLRKEVIHALKQTGEFGEQKDGMDMALVSINVETLQCQYAGANNPLYLVRKGGLTEYKADRMPIAIHQSMKRFKTHDIQLLPGDQLYLFSDGYADQFGGKDDRKFKYKAFRQMLVDNSRKSMKQQKKIVADTLARWMGKTEQVDDILVLGLRV